MTCYTYAPAPTFALITYGVDAYWRKYLHRKTNADGDPMEIYTYPIVTEVGS